MSEEKKERKRGRRYHVVERKTLGQIRQEIKTKRGPKKCQGMTNEGKRCKRDAVYSLDFTKGLTIKGYNLMDRWDCCFLCTQHLKKALLILGVKGIYTVLGSLLTRKMSYDDYLMYHPEYIDEVKKNIFY